MHTNDMTGTRWCDVGKMGGTVFVGKCDDGGSAKGVGMVWRGEFDENGVCEDGIVDVDG